MYNEYLVSLFSHLVLHQDLFCEGASSDEPDSGQVSYLVYSHIYRYPQTVLVMEARTYPLSLPDSD